jgi:hypothetical protein
MEREELKSLIKNIPIDSMIPCKYRFIDGPIEEGLLYSDRYCVWLKHNCGYSHHGDGHQIKGYNYSWFLHRRSTGVFDLNDIEFITIDRTCITIGEL